MWCPSTSWTSSALTATPTLGASGTLGSQTFGNATSGLLTLQPVTGALGSVTVSLPAATDMDASHSSLTTGVRVHPVLAFVRVVEERQARDRAVLARGVVDGVEAHCEASQRSRRMAEDVLK